MSKGYIYVASKDKMFYELGLQSAESLRDFYPDANITLFTHEAFKDERSKIFSNVVTGIPIHKRAKMWAMARTPYDQTFYNDCDSQILHPDIKYVFDELDDCDMYFTESFWYTTGNYKWAFIDKAQEIPAPYHGAVCCYNSSKLVLDFMQTWFEEYLKQQKEDWKFSDFAYPEWRGFDMFTLWKLTSKRFEEFQKFDKLNIKLGPKRFNATIHDQGGVKEYGRKPVVNMQIDKTTFKSLAIWKTIEKGINDERDLPKQPEIGEYSLPYN